MDTQTQTPVITIRETDLFSVYCHALESGEFTQIRGQMYGPDNGRCAYGVASTIAQRAGFDRCFEDAYEALHPQLLDIMQRAGVLLGCENVAAANDAGHSFTLLAAALRRARIDVEAESRESRIGVS